MQRKKILTLIIVFFGTLPISYIINAYILLGSALVVLVFIILKALSVEVYWVTGATIAYITSTILTSLFFTFIAWLLIKPIENQKNLIPILVFFATIPVWLIINSFNPLSRSIADTLRIRIGAALASLVLVLLFIVVPSLFFAFIAWFLVKSKKNPKVQTGAEK